MSDFQGLYNIRDGNGNDYNFILATFLRGLYYGDSWFSKIPKDIFMNNYKHVAAAIIYSDKTAIKIACLPDEPNVILGYSVMSSDYTTVHWVFVKKAWRQKGIGSSLVPKHPAYVSHLTTLGSSLLSKINNATFNPFAV